MPKCCALIRVTCGAQIRCEIVPVERSVGISDLSFLMIDRNGNRIGMRSFRAEKYPPAFAAIVMRVSLIPHSPRLFRWS